MAVEEKPSLRSEELFQQALALPSEERELLLKFLVESMESGPELMTDAEWEEAWGPELDRRVRDAREGRIKGLPLKEAMAQLHARLAKL